jgi:hypothetical protein
MNTEEIIAIKAELKLKYNIDSDRDLINQLGIEDEDKSKLIPVKKVQEMIESVRGGNADTSDSGLHLQRVSKRSELLIAFMDYMRYEYGTGAIPQHNNVVERFLKSNL